MIIDETTMDDIEQEANKIFKEMENKGISKQDAVIMASVTIFVEMFDNFCENVLQLKNAVGDVYKVEASIHDFHKKREPMLMLVVDIGLQITNRFPEISRMFFQEHVDLFRTSIKNIGLTGSVKGIYDIQSDFHHFNRLVDGGLMSNQLASALASFEGVTPDYQRLYMSGLKSLGKHKTGRMTFDLLVKYGRGIPMTKIEIANDSNKHDKTIEKGIKEILEHAGHLIRVVQRGKQDTFYIPDKIRRLHFS